MSIAWLVGLVAALAIAIEEVRIARARTKLAELRRRLELMRHDRDITKTQLLEVVDELKRSRLAHHSSMAVERSRGDDASAVLDGLPDTPAGRAALRARRERMRSPLPEAAGDPAGD